MLRLQTFLLGALLLITNTLALTYRGADFSSLPLLEAKGQKYSDGGSTKALEKILASHGTNLARIRVWAADNSDYNLAKMVALGVRAKAAGMSVMVDLHYSDTCRFNLLDCVRDYSDGVADATCAGADPSKQGIPSGWAKDLSGLNTAVYELVLVQSTVHQS